MNRYTLKIKHRPETIKLVGMDKAQVCRMIGLDPSFVKVIKKEPLEIVPHSEDH